MSIIAYPLEATEYTAEDVQSYLSTRTSGVYSEEITLTPEGMTATISPFLAWFNYAKFKGCSVAVTEPETLNFSPAHAVLNRIDRVVLRLDFSLNRAYLKVIEGIASSTPTPPEITKTEAVYDISPFYVRIRAGATEITAADITSTILDENVCGIMRDGVTGIPTSQLQAQAEDLIIRLHEAINSIESNSAFMLSDLYDPDKKGKPVAFADEVLSLNGGIVKGNVELKTGEKKDIYVRVGNNQHTGTLFASSWGCFGLWSEKLAKYIFATDLNGNLFFNGSDASNGVMPYHSGNKPTGTYTGNGAEERSIQIGGNGSVLMITSGNGILFLRRDGGIGLLKGMADAVQTVASGQARFIDGTLKITNQTYNLLFNEAGEKYTWQVL